MNFRSDLALERREMFAGEIAGIESLRHDNDGISVTHVKIKDDDAAQKIGKPIGNYVTIEIKDLSLPDDEICDRAVNAVSAELKKLINEDWSDRGTIKTITYKHKGSRIFKLFIKSFKKFINGE